MLVIAAAAREDELAAATAAAAGDAALGDMLMGSRLEWNDADGCTEGTGETTRGSSTTELPRLAWMGEPSDMERMDGLMG